MKKVKHQTRVSYKCAANGCEFTSLVAADMKRHMALEHVLIVKNADGTGTNVIRRSGEIEAQNANKNLLRILLRAGDGVQQQQITLISD